MQKNQNLFYFFVGIVYLLVFTSVKFIGLILIPIIWFYDFNYKIKSVEKIVLFVAVLTMYIKIYYFALFENLNNNWINYLSLNNEIRFGDLQATLFQIKCNSQIILENITHEMLYSNFSYLCPINVGYGPLMNYINFDLNVWNSTLIFAFLFSFMLFYSLYKTYLHKSDIFTLYILLFSPTLILLYTRMNLDILIIPLIYIFLKKFGENSYIFLILLFLLSLLKIYPAILIFFIIVKKWYFKKKLLRNQYLASLIMIIYLTFSKDLLTTSSIRPSQSNIAFGLLTNSQELWIRVLKYYGGYRYVLLIYFLIGVILSIISFVLYKKNKFIINLSEHELLLMLFFIGVFFYANYDQRAVLFIFSSLPFIKHSDKFIRKLFITTILLFALPEIKTYYFLDLLSIIKTLVIYFCVSIYVVNILNKFSEIRFKKQMK